MGLWGPFHLKRPLATIFTVSENGGLQFKKTILRHALLAFVLRLKQVSPELDQKFDTKEKLIQKGKQLLYLYGSKALTLVSRQLVVATTTKPNLGHLAPASEVAGGHTIPF
jgi:hypothetical protein